jgi:hypothetical protein
LSQGRVPFHFRIGITGHRCLDDPGALIPAIRQALRQLRGLLPEGPDADVVLVAVSALAEGADRLVARELLAEPGSRLEVVLPLARTDYVGDFQDAESKREFRHLLGLASQVRQAPRHLTREEAYEWAGQQVVDRCDALIAVWDGKPPRGRGGTAEIVRYARDCGVPLAVVSTKGEPPVPAEADRDGERWKALLAALRDLTEYNESAITDEAFAAQVQVQRGEFGLTSAPDDAFEQAREHLAAWMIPFLVRADLLATRVQPQFRAVSTGMFGMAAAAVAVVAFQISFLPHEDWAFFLEVALLLALLASPQVASRLRLHNRWTSYRFLAERLRSAYFLALAGTADGVRQPGQSASFSDPSVAWIERALAEIMAGRPKTEHALADVDPLRDYLSRFWVGRQMGYHDKAFAHNDRWEHRLRHATAVLFGITLIAAVLHAAGVGPSLHLTTDLVVLSIAVPAIGAAIHGVGTQREYRRHAERCRRMIVQLARLEFQMSEARSLREIRQVAANVERSMREESNDWFGVMRFHDIELIV